MNGPVCRFEMSETALVFEEGKSILLCKARGEGEKKIWAKKIPEGHVITAVLEDPLRYYVACDYSARDGIFLALGKESGSTEWYIPGRSLLHVLFKGQLFLVFVDGEGVYFLIKVDPQDGSKSWHRTVEEDLQEYSFFRDRITLKYRSGRREAISVADGGLL